MWPILAFGTLAVILGHIFVCHNHRTYFQRLFIEELNVNTGAHGPIVILLYRVAIVNISICAV